MRYVNGILLILVMCLVSLRVGAQQVNMVSHYPTSAYIVNRLLPFSVVGGGGVEILSVNLKQGDGCKVFVDRFFSDTFHFYCSEPVATSAEIVYLTNSNQKFNSSTAIINIIEESVPSEISTPVAVPGVPSLFNKSEGE